MYVLVIAQHKPERESIARVLQQGGYRVDLATDVKCAGSYLDMGMPQIVVMTWSPTGGAEFIRHVRSLEGATRPYVIVLLDDRQTSEIAAAYAAGADDFMRRPVLREELLGRAGAPRRIARWAPIGMSPEGPSVDLSRLQAFERLAGIASEDLGQMLGEALVVEDGWPCLDAPLRGATVSLTLATDKTELRLSILVDPEGQRALGATVLGDPAADGALVEDVLCEVANTAGGAVKRASLTEAVTFTLGIPVNAHAAPADGPLTRHWSASTASGNLKLGIAAQILRRDNQRVTVAELEEGMVVAHDLRSDSGALLIAAGTRLTATSASRLAQILGGRYLVEVACAA